MDITRLYRSTIFNHKSRCSHRASLALFIKIRFLNRDISFRYRTRSRILVVKTSDYFSLASVSCNLERATSPPSLPFSLLYPYSHRFLRKKNKVGRKLNYILDGHGWYRGERKTERERGREEEREK